MYLIPSDFLPKTGSKASIAENEAGVQEKSSAAGELRKRRENLFAITPGSDIIVAKMRVEAGGKEGDLYPPDEQESEENKMNCIGIIGAMEEEVTALKEQMQQVQVIRKASMEFNEGMLEGKKVVVVRSGIGKVNAAVCTQILIDDFAVEAVINTGIAGSLKNEINIGDIVLSTDVVHHDMDARGFGYAKGQIPRMEVLSFPADESLIALGERMCREVNPEIQVFTGRVASGDQFISDQNVKEQIIQEFQGYCTEMEGAAIGQTAWLNQIPFLIIRAISDKADDSATVDYPTFEKQAIAHCVKLTQNMIKYL